MSAPANVPTVVGLPSAAPQDWFSLGAWLTQFGQTVLGWIAQAATALNYLLLGVSRDLNALNFGADPTGRTSSNNALNAAIDAARAQGGGDIYFPPGTYTLSGTFTINFSGCRIRGAGEFATTLNWIGPSSDCLVVISNQPAPAQIAGFELSDMAVNVVNPTGGYFVSMQYVYSGWIRRVSVSTPYNGLQFYATNNCGAHTVVLQGCKGNEGIDWEAPADGSINSASLTLTDIVVQCLFGGCNGMYMNGWVTTVNATNVAFLGTRVGLQIANTAASTSYFPAFGSFVNCQWDGASLCALLGQAGVQMQFVNCWISNGSGDTGQGSADGQAVQLSADVGASYTNTWYFTNCIIGLAKIGAVVSAARNVKFHGCSFVSASTTPANTYPAIEIASPAQDTIIMGCDWGIWGQAASWAWGLAMDSGTSRTLAVGNNWGIEIGTAPYVNNSTDTNTFVNDFIGSTVQPGAILQAPKYAGTPSAPGSGQIIFNSSTGHLEYWNGSAWVSL